MKHTLSLFLAMLASISLNAQIPELYRHENGTQLLIGGKPFIILGGKLGDSSASSEIYMNEKDIWKDLSETGLNTVLAPVYWELIEPQEDRFDFSSVDHLLRSARENDVKLVLLWFGGWKDGMSCYTPSWMKRRFGKDFDLARDTDGNPMESLSAFSERNVQAESKAFAMLMKYLKKADGSEGTVMMVQVENGTGISGASREYGQLSENAYRSPVPYEVIYMLSSGKAGKHIESIWKAAGSHTAGSWPEVFGTGPDADEIFMAYWNARYVGKVADAGKNEYKIPMYVNAYEDLNGGPSAHLMPIWKLAAPCIDIICPSIRRNSSYTDFIADYATADNQMFIPETHQDAAGIAKVFHALGHYGAIGFCPADVDYMSDSDRCTLKQVYSLLTPALDLIAEKQCVGKAYGVLVDDKSSESTITVNDISFTLRNESSSGSATILDMGNDEYLFIGTGISVSMNSTEDRYRTGIERVDEIRFDEYGKMHKIRRLNGDDTDQGRAMKIPAGEYGARLLKTYRY